MPVVRRLMTTSMTSHVDEVILVTSQSSKSLYSETRSRINYPCGPFEHTLSLNIAFKKSAHSA